MVEPISMTVGTIVIAKTSGLTALGTTVGNWALNNLNRITGNTHNRETQMILEEKRQGMQMEQMKFQYLQQKDNQEFQVQLSQLNADRQRELQEYIQDCNRRLQQDSQEFQRWKFEQEKFLQLALSQYGRETQMILEEKRQGMQMEQMKFQYLQQKDNQEFQVQLSQLNADRQRELQEYIQDCNRRLQQDSQEFQRWKFEQEKFLQLALSEYGRETQLIVAAYHRETALKMPEVNKIFDVWPLTIYPSQILEPSQRSPRPPIRVIIAPPKLNFDKNDPRVEKLRDFQPETALNSKLLHFIGENYPLQDSQRSIDFISSAWDTKRARGKAAIKALHSMLQSESILVLESEIDGDYLELRWGFWAANEPEPTYEMLYRFRYWDLVENSIKERCRKIRAQRERLREQQINPAIFSEIDLTNLKMLETEEKLIELKEDISYASLPYRSTAKDFEVVTDWLGMNHCWRVALFADIYYLTRNYTVPLLPQLLPQLFPGGVKPELVEHIIQLYDRTLEDLALERSHLIPDLRLDLALRFAHLSNLTYAKAEVIKSLQSFIHIRQNIMANDLEACLLAVKKYLTVSDRDYVDQLNHVFAQVEIDEKIDLADCCYQRAMEYYGNGAAQSSISDFTQSIALRENLAAYYYRALAHIQLQEYATAIADLTQVVNCAALDTLVDGFNLLGSAYERRGLVYYKLYDYHSAIPDFDRAFDLGVTTAAKEREIIYRGLESDELKSFNFETVTVNRRGEIIERETKQTQYFNENFGEYTTLEMVVIPGGTFMMGSPKEEGSPSEKPQHEVTIQSFFMGKYQVTQAQWKAVAALPLVNRKLKPNLSHFKGANRPVEQVSWQDAVEFCDRLSRHTKRQYRLPSEAEWEYACRAGTTTPFHFGETITTDLANYQGTDNEKYKWSGSYGQGPKGVYKEETTEVGSFGVANNFGLYDMHGNVWEWCQDSWHSNYKGAPIDGSAWLDNEESSNRKLLRGGSCDYLPGNCRSACRLSNLLDDYYLNIGFRVVCSGAART